MECYVTNETMTTALLLLWAILGTVSAEGQKSGSGESVGCFVCHSYNDSNPRCMDPFSPSETMYQSKCESGLSGRVGTFPAHYCIKMNGVSVTTGSQVTVRACSLKTMNVQCGLFQFDDVQYRGCLTSCDKNGCNGATSHLRHATSMWRVLITSLCLLLTSYVSAGCCS